MRRGLLFISFIILSLRLLAQSCVPSTINNSTINFPCGVNCDQISLQVPHLKSTSTYVLTQIPYQPYEYVTPGGIELTSLYADDTYSDKIPIPFNFCFYDSVFTKLVVGSNGLITFDTANANCDNAWTISTGIFLAGGTICNSNATYYPKASIMGAYSDLDPRTVASPGDRKIEWRVEGFAPCRKLIVSYYHVGVFGSSCGLSTPNTFQIVIYESTGLIDIFFEAKTCFSSTNAGRAILGVQNWERNQAVAAPGRNATQWNAFNEGWRFIPNGGSSRFVRSELLTLSGSLVGIADTTTTTEGLLDISFPNVCPTGNSEQFVVKTTYNACGLGDQLITYDTITVVRTTSLGAAFTATNIQCNTGSGGTITVQVPNGAGQPPYQYSINAGPLQSANTFTNLSNGNYTVFVTDVNGCTDSENLTIATTGNLGVTASITPTPCSGSNGGAILASATGGFPPYQYSLNGGAFQPSGNFTGLGAGSYTVSATDSRGCSGTQVFNVGSGSALSATTIINQPNCNGAANGSVTINVAGGSGPFQYSIDNINWQASNIFSGLPAGIYTFYFRDASNCTGTVNVQINQPPALNLTISTQAALCNGQSNGSITVNASGGVAPYNYSLDGINYSASGTFNVAAGSYSVYVRDINGCVRQGMANVGQPAALTLSVNTTDATCNGGNNGVLTISASGGTAPYQYSLNGGTSQSSNVFNLIAGIYQVTITDANNCLQSMQAIVGLQDDLVLQVSADTVICEGSSVQLNANGNALSYSWSPSTGLSNVSASNPIASPVSNTGYIVTATLGVCSKKDTVMVLVLPAPVPDGGPDGDICYGQDFQLSGSGGIQYLWSPATGLSDASASSPVSVPDKTIIYFLHVRDANGCISLQPDQVIVNVTPPIIVKTFPSDTIVHAGDIFRLLATSAGTDYVWSPPTGLDDPFVADPELTVISSVILKVIATTSAGCKGEGEVNIKVYNGPEIYVPTGFTPNGDGRNDVFKPVPVGIKQIKYFRVFNRWGQMVYSTNSFNQGWDGKINGIAQPPGTYVWLVEGITKDDRVIRKRGTVTLIR